MQEKKERNPEGEGKIHNWMQQGTDVFREFCKEGTAFVVNLAATEGLWD